VPSSRIGPYEVLGELGRGGVGVVYRARGPDGADVALKLLLRPDSPERIARFRREAELQGLFSRAEGFVPLLESGATPDGKPWLASHFLPGGTLRARLAKGPLAIDHVVALGRALASAMARAHARGLVHRDLKPENVLFDEEDRPLVADLGLAKLVDGAPGAVSLGLSLTGQARGTYGYMPAEQARDAKHAAPSADIFALGAILYECLACRPAFSGDSAVELLVALEKGAFEPLARARPDAPRWLADVVERCLALDPASRPRDGAELERALEKPRRRVKWSLVAVAAALALVAPPLAALVWRARRAPEPPVADPAPATVQGPATSRPMATSWALPPFEPDPDPLAPGSGFFTWKLTKPPAVLGSFAWSHSEGVNHIAVSPDGKLALSGGADGRVKLWDVASGRALRTIRPAGKFMHILSVAFTRDSRSIVAASMEGDLLRLDLVARRELARVHVGELWSIAVLPDGRALVGCRDGMVRLVDLDSRSVVDSIDAGAGEICALALSPDGSLGAAGCSGGALVLFSTSRLAIVRTLPAPGTRVLGTILDRRGRAIAGCEDGRVRVWEARTGRELAFANFPGVSHEAIAETPDELRLVSATADGTVWVGDLDGLRRPRPLGAHAGRASGVAVSPDGRIVFSCGGDRTVRLWDLEKGGPIGEPPGHRGAVTALAASPDGKTIVSGGEDRTVRIWDRATRACVRTLRGHEALLRAVALSSDGARLMTSSDDATIRLWDLATGRELTVLRGPQADVTGVAFVGSTVLSCSRDRTLRSWDPASGALLRSYDLGTVEAWSMAVTRDGRRATLGDKDDQMWACDLESGDVRPIFVQRSPHADKPIFFQALDAEGRIGFSGGLGGALHVWGVEGGVIKSLLHGCQVFGVAPVPDSKKVVTAAYEDQLRLWDVTGSSEPESLLMLPHDHGCSLTATRTSLVAGTARGVVLDFAFEKR
jgi:WD40 repeat protein